MSGQRFNPGQVFKWQEELYEVRQLLAGDQINLVKLRTGATQAVTAVQLVQALLTGELQFVTQTVLDPRPAPSEPMTLADYTEVQRAVAEYRLEIIRPFLALPPQERRQAIIARVQELRRQRRTRTLDKAVSMASIYRWIRAYTDSQGDPRSLVPQTTQRGGQHTTRLQADTEAIVKATIDDHYYVREHRTIDYMHREVAVRIEAENQRRRPSEQLKLPSRATLARRLGNLEIQATLEAKRGHRTARRHLTQYQATAYPTIPLERVEIDHTRTDLVVIDEHDHLPLGRLTLTYALDTATRYPLGYYLGFEPPSYLAVMACLHHMIWPKAGVQTRYNTQHDWLAYGTPYTRCTKDLLLDGQRQRQMFTTSRDSRPLTT